MKWIRYAIAGLSGLVGGLAIGTVNYGFGVFVNGIAESEPTWSRTEISSALSVMSICAGLVSPVMGALIDRFGVVNTVSLSIILQMSGFFCLGQTYSKSLLYVSYFLIGCGHAGTAMLGPGKVVGDLFPGKNKGRVMGFVTSFNNICGLVFVQVVTKLSEDFGWQTAASVFGGLFLALFIIYFAIMTRYYKKILKQVEDEKASPPQIVDDNQEEEEEEGKGAIANEASIDHCKKSNGSGVRDEKEQLDDAQDKEAQNKKDLNDDDLALMDHANSFSIASNKEEGNVAMENEPRTTNTSQQSSITQQQDQHDQQNKNKKLGSCKSPFFQSMFTFVFVFTALGTMCAEYTYNGVLSQIVPALVAEGMTETESASVLSLVAALGIGSKMTCGWMSEKVTARRAIELCMIIESLSLTVLVIWAPDVRAIWPAFAFYGMSFGGIGALRPLVVLETFGNEFFGKIYGVLLLLFLIPALIAPIVAGMSYDHSGRYMNAFAAAIVVFVIGAGLLEIGGRFLRKKQSAQTVGVENEGNR